jgi:Protein of unknown function (DUF3307)
MRGYSAGAAHLLGDYVVQSDWMANEKTKAHLPAALHAATYTACFLPLTQSPRALAVIGATHFVIDRWRLARHLVWAKNQLAPADYRYPWSHGSGTGYHAEIEPYLHEDNPEGCVAIGKPAWMAVWLMIIADNTAHITINSWALSRWGH